MLFSFIIPVYNRPDEIRELLQSIDQLKAAAPFEVVVIEDGSTIPCRDVIDEFAGRFTIQYHFKENSGPGDSRNFGMRSAKGDYFLIFDSDCILPEQYLAEVVKELSREPVDFFGGPDRALDSFSPIQKAINFAMTSFLTTGGVRGGSQASGKFQPRSFNMGISKKAFEASAGFGNIHPGEDPDLVLRLWKAGFKSRLFADAYVFHKRRIDWEKFALQVEKFGKARPILDSWHPEYSKLTFFFPTAFLGAFAVAVLASFFGNFIFLSLFVIYFCLIFFTSLVQNNSVKIAALSVFATWIQFYGYGTGFAKSFIRIRIFKEDPKKAFPELFFKA